MFLCSHPTIPLLRKGERVLRGGCGGREEYLKENEN
jgi:hypothetical protein